MPALLLAAVVAQAPPAASTPASPLALLGLRPVQAMSPEETARTRARVDAAIAASGAPPGAVENITDANGGRVRHAASRLTCALGTEGDSVRSSGPDDMACEHHDGEQLYRLSVARAPAGAALDAVAAQAAAQVRRESGYAQTPGPVAVARPRPGSGLPEHRTLVFRSRVDGRERWSRLMVGLVDGWILTERSLSPSAPQGFSMGDILAEASFGSAMRPPAAAPGDT